MKIFGSRVRPANGRQRIGWVLISRKGKSIQSRRDYEASLAFSGADVKKARLIDYSEYLSWYNEHKATESAVNEYSRTYELAQKQKRLKFIVS